MLKELEHFVLNVPYKGKLLRAALSIAMGETNQGIVHLKEGIEISRIKLKESRIKNEKVKENST